MVQRHHRSVCGAARRITQQQLLPNSETRRKVPGTNVAARRQFGVASFMFGADTPPEAARADWEDGLDLTKNGQPSDAEVAFHRALTGIDTSGYSPHSGQGRATVAALWRDLARAQSMQGKQHEATPLLKRELLIHRRLHGEDAPQTLDCLHSLVHLLQQQARCRPLCIVTATTTATPIS